MKYCSPSKRFKDDSSELGNHCNKIVSKYDEIITPAKEAMLNLANESKKLFSSSKIKKKLCMVVPDFANVKGEELESADTILARLKAKN